MDDITFHVGGDTLVLNCDMQPISMIPISTVNWRDAIKAHYLDQVDVLETYEDWVVRSPSVEMKVPAVVMTRNWVRLGRTVKFSRHNVYMRDRHTCQYCNEVFQHDDLTWDHVKPRVEGGKTNWENIVTACSPCNHRKSHFHEMKPMRPARKPTYGEMIAIMKEKPLIIGHSSWNNYLGWPEDKVTVSK